MKQKNRNKITTEIIIEGTREEVWSILVDLEKYSAWNPFITRSSGEIRIGKTLENTMMNGGKTMTFKPVITDLQEEQRLEWLGKAFLGSFKGRHYFELADAGEGYTKLIQGETFTGILAPLLMSMMRENTEKGFIAMNKSLRTRLLSLKGQAPGE